MSKTRPKPSSSTTRITECPVRAFEHYVERNPLPTVARATVVGALTRGSRTLEEANRDVSTARCNGAFAQTRTRNGGLYLVDSDCSAETLLEMLTEYLERTENVNDCLVGAINGRRQQLRNGGDA